MASYPPPNEIVPIFNSSNYLFGSAGLTITEADARYLQLSGGIERGFVTFQSGLSVASITSGGFTFTMPGSSGQLALVSQIPTNANYVDTTTNQTNILGDKTWNGVANFNGAVAIGGTGSFTISSGSAIATIQNTSLSNATLILPSSTGTIALVSQIPTNSTYVDLTTSQNISGIKTFTTQQILNNGFLQTGSPNVGSSGVLTGLTLNSQAGTYNNTFTAGSGTVAQVSDLSLAIKTLTATNTLVTYTNAASLYIAGAPSASTNITITNPYALQIAAGKISIADSIVSSNNGTVTNPIFSVGGTNTGMYAGASSQLNFTINGTSRFAISTSSITSTIVLRTANGTAANTGLGFVGDSASGLYLVAANNPAMSAQGTQIMSYTATKSSVAVNGSAATPSFGFLSDTSSGLYRSAANQIAASISGVNVWTTASTGLTVSGQTTTTTLKNGSNGTVINQIQQGSFTFTNVPVTSLTANTQTVTFAAAFSSAPNVILTINYISGAFQERCIVIAAGVTTTQFTCYVYQTDPINAATSNINISYIAMN